MLKIGDRVKVTIVGVINETTRMSDGRVRVHIESDTGNVDDIKNRARVFATDCVLIEPS